MYTTAGGLVVAIPTLVLHSIIAARTTKIMDDVDQFALKTVNLLGARRRGTLKEDGAAANG
jgi:biopolymer transport protein ExbB/TolQ